MVAAVSFQTRARTIDHLGREQIADCPTAISELWKNAYDAYAHNVALHIFDGKSPVATLVDDGHGMTMTDLQEKWLIVGTESKAVTSELPVQDMNGISKERVKQGQKGIGRLSCAALGSLLLLVSKKKGEQFVACLLDWRLFENPFLMLHDIQLPVDEFSTREELTELLPSMFDSLMGNIWGDGNDAARDKRIDAAWSSYDQQEVADKKEQTTKEKIEATIIGEAFSERHFNTWPLWSGKADCGTAMIIGDIHDDLTAQLKAEAGSELDGPELRAKESFIQTLTSFTNPFAKEHEDPISDFKTSVIAHNGSLQRFVIDEIRDFGLENFEQLEHIIEGEVDEQGLFVGRVKAFGEWHEDVIVQPKARYKTRKDTRFGPFRLRLGTFEIMAKNTTLSAEQHSTFESWKERFGGMMVFRDNLRVMPYGREDNDYFEIEKRRTKNAGMYAFSNRNIFGGVSISKANNPNLKDKAGREGIIDIKASKLFREIVEKILVDVAKRFIGRSSDIRKEVLEDLAQKHAAEKAAGDRKKLLKKEQKRVKSAINTNLPNLNVLQQSLHEISEKLEARLALNDQDEIVQLKHSINELNGELKEMSLSPIPKTLGSIENAYREYRDIEIHSKSLVKQLNESLAVALDKLVEKNDIDIADKDFRSKAAILHAKIKKYATQGKKLINDELQRFEEEISIANKAFHKELSDHLDDLNAGRTSLPAVTQLMEAEFEKQDIQLNQKFNPYITALGSLKNQIDLEGLALHSLNENTTLRAEVERVNSLAQLGISVEIIGHEIEGLDMTMERGIKSLNESNLDMIQQTALESVKVAHQSLSDAWRFLSTLKLSGEKVKTTITGDDIYHYVLEFFGDRLKSNNIGFEQTSAFEKFSIFEQPAKIYPVFINLINNSRYWVRHTKEETQKIILDFKDGKVFVSDNGPGVDIDDKNNLFTIFFTRKQRGGRGVGLYLCKMNLQAGGHSIYYEDKEENKLLSGANFVVAFKGVQAND